MEYAGSYALFNYRLADPSRGLEYDNLRLIRAFEKGLDPNSSEAGFVLVHVDMVKHSGPLVVGTVMALDACEADDREGFERGLERVVGAMKRVNEVMDGMHFSLSLLMLFSIVSRGFCKGGKRKDAGIDIFKLCGTKANRTITTPSARSSSASHRKPCFPTA